MKSSISLDSSSPDWSNSQLVKHTKKIALLTLLKSVAMAATILLVLKFGFSWF